jgi:ABC transporter related
MYKTLKLLILKHKIGLVYTFGIIIVAAMLAPFAVSLLSSILENSSNFGTANFVKSILFFIFIFLLSNISEEYVDYQKRKMIQILQIDLRLNITDKLVHGEYGRVKAIHSGDWLYYQTLADEAVFSYFYPIFNASSFIVTILSASYCIIKIDKLLFFYIFISIVVWVLLEKFILKNSKNTFEVVLRSKKQISRYVSQVLEAKNDIVSWSKEKSTELKMFRYHQILKEKLIRKSAFVNIREQGDRIVFIAIIVLTILIGKNKGYEENKIIALYLYINLLYGSVTKINTVLQDCLEVNVKFEELNMVTDINIESVYNLTEISEELVLDNIGVKIADKQILEGINLKMKKGECVAICGNSGGGKSTLLNSIAGFIEIEGSIIWNGENIVIDGKSRLMPLISLLPQENKLFEGTALENICFSNYQYEEDKLINAIDLSGLNKEFPTIDVIRNFKILEKGENLSGGQIQRLCLARAIYDDCPIMLLDEPTYALDKDTANDIISTINRIRKEKFILISTHDVYVKKICNKIIYI